MQIHPLVISPSTLLPPHTTKTSSNTSHNINRPHERRRPVDSPCRSLQHLNPHDVAQVYGQVHRVVARLRVTDIDAVQQEDDLFGSTASNGDVRLSTNRSSLTDIHADGVFQQIVNTLYGSLRNVGTVQYCDHSCSLTFRQGRPRAGHTDLLELHLAGCCHGCRVCHHRVCADTLRRGVSQRGHREHAAHHLSAQTAEQRVALVTEMSEHEHLALIKSW